MNENGAKIQRGLNLWLSENWKLLVVVAGVIAWGARIEGRTDDRYTGAQAEADKASLMLLVDERLDAMHLDIVEIKTDTAFIKGKIESEEDNEGEE